MRIDRMSVRIAAAVCMCLITGAQAMEPIQHWQTDNGARVYFAPARELPMLDVRVVFDAGSARDGAQAGVARLTNALLDQGAKGLSADAIAEQLEGVGARLGGGALRDMAWLSLRSLTDPALLDPALTLFAQLLANPDFTTEAFARERQRMLVALDQRDQDPGEVAEEAFFAATYGEHPYASQPDGTRESLQALTRDAVVEFHRRHYVGSNAVVAIVGDLDRAGAERVALAAVGKLPPGTALAQVPQPAPLAEALERRIDHPSSQTHIWMGEPGITRTDPDYFPLYVGNHVLGGGGMVSRLFDTIREKRGLSYSVYSYFFPMAAQGPYRLGLQTRNDQSDAALALLREELKRFVDSGPTAEELAASKKNITGGQPLRVDSNSKIIDSLAMIGFYGLPLDYLDTFNAKVEAVNLDDIRDAFRRRVHPERMVTVIVGGQSQPADR